MSFWKPNRVVYLSQVKVSQVKSAVVSPKVIVAMQCDRRFLFVSNRNFRDTGTDINKR